MDSIQSGECTGLVLVVAATTDAEDESAHRSSSLKHSIQKPGVVARVHTAKDHCLLAQAARTMNAVQMQYAVFILYTMLSCTANNR